MSKAEFGRSFAHPWLLREVVVDDASPIPFRTRTVASSEPPPSLSMRPPPSSMLSRVAHDLKRFDVLPIVKSSTSPWEERFLVGRATNNDIILRDPSVSKTHAHFARETAERWRLHARSTRNGTLVEGRVLEANDSAVVECTMAIQFGNIRCTFLDSATLFEVLAIAGAGA